MLRHLILLTALLAGCQSLPVRQGEPPNSPRIVTLVWSKDFTREAVAQWERQIQHRFGNRRMVVLCCHGDEEELPWALDPDAPRHQVRTADAVLSIRLLYPDRLIVLLSCNPMHDRLDLPHVAYADDSIFIWPGDDVRINRFGDAIYGVGGIDEFTVNP